MKQAGIVTALALGVLLTLPQVQAQTYSRTEVISYHDNTTLWVLGQIAKVTNTNTTPNAVISETIYDASTALPLQTYSFGKLQQTLTYNIDGTIATVTDGNTHTTTLSSWKRGIPQIIHHPATPESPSGAYEYAEVNDNGWLNWVKDENSYQTGYTYDAMGRLTGITPPEGNATTQVFEPVTTAQYGLAAGHWRQTITRGNYKKTSYFDALWRPVVTQEEDTSNSSGTLRWSATRYDAEGHVVFASYPRNPFVDGWVNFDDTSLKGSRTRYDALGRVTHVEQDSELGVLTTVTEYLPGFLRKITNPRGFATTQRFEAYDVPSYDAPVQIDAPGGVKTTIARDSLGKPTAVTRSGPEG